MISKKDIQFIKEQIEFHKEPLLSVYADVNPAKPENLNNAWKIRIKNSLKDFDIPDYIKKKVFEFLDIERPSARTIAIFAADDLIERYDLQIDIPVVDLANGKVDVSWGKPNVSPLIFAIDEYERTGVLYLKKTGWHFYEFFLGELKELDDSFKEVSAAEWEALNNNIKEVYHDLLKSRVPTHPDKFPKRVNSFVIRFYKQLAHLVEKIIASKEIKRLILVGPDEQTKHFAQFLSKSVRSIIISFAGDLPVQDSSTSIIYEKVNPIIEKLERDYEKILIDEIEKSNYVSGIENTLEALQNGRIYSLIVPWKLNVKVWSCDNGHISTSEEKVKELCGNDNIKNIDLKSIIIDLALDYGAKLEFVRGDAEELLIKKYNGLVGLLRW
ncbi:Hypothetical protein IALB_0007 [Ignavibacterium album JCM 16511]|uniref:Uncharacterized protein n=1 Tax=Ignavibacterium album (strain DSM 19864 / JCM 16511 / NBRC 101810 / Mat9-16) TaxID=945713 RepID=I0AFG4_IGNAJ|nr:VLRF1 family aeRF1-type release factor [Ignavibacterium album]AFH47721.1 Hypothetical protein IALB_0007 [Ignavibacterium album JCM 16511]